MEAGRRSRSSGKTVRWRGSVAFRCEPLPVDEQVSEAWALLVSRLRSSGAEAPINDTWIAATALALGVPVATQDNDYDEMPGLEVIKF